MTKIMFFPDEDHVMAISHFIKLYLNMDENFSGHAVGAFFGIRRPVIL
jgi:hypothetical protein